MLRTDTGWIFDGIALKRNANVFISWLLWMWNEAKETKTQTIKTASNKWTFSTFEIFRVLCVFWHRFTKHIWPCSIHWNTHFRSAFLLFFVSECFCFFFYSSSIFLVLFCLLLFSARFVFIAWCSIHLAKCNGKLRASDKLCVYFNKTWTKNGKEPLKNGR